MFHVSYMTDFYIYIKILLDSHCLHECFKTFKEQHSLCIVVYIQMQILDRSMGHKFYPWHCAVVFEGPRPFYSAVLYRIIFDTLYEYIFQCKMKLNI